MALIMVLDDGVTYSGLEGCSIVEVPDEWPVDEIERLLSEYDDDTRGVRSDLKTVEARLTANGGRGVEDADMVDLLRAILDTKIITTFTV